MFALPRLATRLLIAAVLFIAAFRLLYTSFSDSLSPHIDRLTSALPAAPQFPPISHPKLAPSPPNSHSDPDTNSESRPHPGPQEPQDTRTPTIIPGNAHVHGFTVFDNLYVRNGTFFVVTPDEASFPPKRNLIARPFEVGGGEKNEPTDEDLRFITPAEARDILGEHAIRVPDVSFILYDPDQFMKHFYHWWGEIILGAWRVYCQLLPDESQGAQRPLPFPARFIMPVVTSNSWRDRAGVDGPLMRATFPYASIEQADYWADFVSLGKTVVFERAMVVNRETAHRHPYGGRWFKMVAGASSLPAPPLFWEPIRRSALLSLLGSVPVLSSQGHVLSPEKMKSDKPVVTYISRQGGGRRLREEDHAGLVKALKALEEEGICEVQVVRMEEMGLAGQLEKVARSTVIVGVHGNGLTHQLWMPPAELSTVFEIMQPPSYVFDYEMLARNVGHRHYAVNNDTLTTYPPGTYHDGVQFADGFHGNDIPVYGPAVADKIRERLRSYVG